MAVTRPWFADVVAPAATPSTGRRRAGAGVARGYARPAVGEAGARPTWGIGRSLSGPIAWPAPRRPAPGQDVRCAHPALARVPPRRHRVERLHPPARPGVVAGRARGNGPQPGASAGGLRPRWRGDRAAGRRRFPAGLRARPLRGLRRRPPGSRLHAGGARAMGRRQRGGRTRASARRPRLPQSRAARRPGRGRDGGGVRREGARLGARVRDARAPGPRRLGGAVARGCARDVRGLGPHPRRGERGLRPGPARARGAARGRHRALAPRGARGRARGAARRGA